MRCNEDKEPIQHEEMGTILSGEEFRKENTRSNICDIRILWKYRSLAVIIESANLQRKDTMVKAV